MTPKSAKRLKASGDNVKEHLSSSTHVHLSAPYLETSSPRFGDDERNQTGSRKKRKKQYPNDGNSVAVAHGVARDLSGWNQGPSLRSEVPGGILSDGLATNYSPQKGVEGRSDASVPVKAESPVSNLDLVRMLRDSKVAKSRKIEVAYEFIQIQETVPDRDDDERKNFEIQGRKVDSMAMPQFVSFLFEWVQSAVLWSSKPQQLTKIPQNLDGEECQRTVPAHLDARYWAILRWCLSSGFLHKLASVAPSLMRSLNLYVVAVVESVDASEHNVDLQNKFGISASLTESSVNSIEVLLLANERSFRPDLDHWVSLASTALSKLANLNELIIDSHEKVMNPFQRLVLLILEGFARFVTNHPNRRKIFTSLVENLLESLLKARAGLITHSNQLSDSTMICESLRWRQRLLQSIDDVLENGLFHAAHVGSFQEVCTALAGKLDDDTKKATTDMKQRKKDPMRDSHGTLKEFDKDMNVSYHRLLFKKLKFFQKEGIEAAMMELGWIFKMYSKSFRIHQSGGDVDVFGIRIKGQPQPLEVTASEGHSNDAEQGGIDKLALSSQFTDKKDRTSETLFNVFAEFIGPLVKDLKYFSHSLTSHKLNLSFQHLVSAEMLLGSVAGLLKAAKTENTYIPTEDSASQEQLTFLDSCFSIILKVGKSLPRLLASDSVKVLVNGTELAGGSSRDTSKGEHKLKALLADLLREVVSAIKYLMDLEYRVVENSLGDIWVILFAEVAFHQSSRGDHLTLGDAAKNANQEAVEVACQMIGTFSDLRQVDRALFSLCTTLRGFMSQGSRASLPEMEHISSRKETNLVSEETSWLAFLNPDAIEFLACAKSLLLAVSSAMHSLPEGQVAEFLRLLRVDALESMTLIDILDSVKHKPGSGNGYSGNMCLAVGLEGLVELYVYMLENVNITGANSVLAGRAVRQFLTQIVAEKLGQLVDFFVLSKTCEDNTSSIGQSEKKIKYEKQGAVLNDFNNCNRTASGKTKEEESLLNDWIFMFFLRLYMTSQSLHRECISLMPPKAAKRASAALDGPAVDYDKGDSPDILAHISARGFFSGVGRGAVKTSHVLAGIQGRRDDLELVECPALCYALDCIALRSLVDLSSNIDLLSFLIFRSKEVTSVMPNDPVIGSKEVDVLRVGEKVSNEDVKQGIQKKMQKLLKILKRESQKLTNFLLKGVERPDNVSPDDELTSEISNSLSYQVMDVDDLKGRSKSRLLMENSQQHFLHQSWDSVEATLTVNTLPIRRWNLLCKSFDIWSKYAMEEDLKRFLGFLFSTSLVTQTTHNAFEDQKNSHVLASQPSYVRHITEDILSNVLFYEDESFRRVYSSAFLEELKKSLLSAFGKWPFGSFSRDDFMTEDALSQIVQEWTAVTTRIEADIGVIGQEQVTSSISTMRCRKTFFSSSNKAAEQFDRQVQDTTPCKGHKLKTEPSASKKQGSISVTRKLPGKQSKNKDLRWSNSHLKALDYSVGLVDHLSTLPPGYIEPRECTTCAHTLLCFERLLINSLLDVRATGLPSSDGPGIAEFADVSTAFKLLKAFSTCRSALLALTWSENPHSGDSPLMAVLAGDFLSMNWLSLSIHAVAACLVDLLVCSNLPAQQRIEIMSLGKVLLHKVLKRTASLVSYISNESLRSRTTKNSHPDAGPVAMTLELTEEHIPNAADQKRGTSILSKLMGCQAEKVDQLVGSSIANELDISQHQADCCDDVSGVSYWEKNCYTGLALSASLSSYFWSLNKFLEDSVAESTPQSRPLLSLTALTHDARRLGHGLTGTLLSALLPVGSHAILLLGEHEVDRSLNSGEETINIRFVNQDNREDNLSAIIPDKDEFEDDDEQDFRSVVDAVVASKVDEEDDKDLEEEEEERDVEVDVGRDTNQALEVNDLMMNEEVGNYGSVIETSEVLYTAESNLQRSLLENMLKVCNSNKCDVIGELFLAMAGVLKLESINLSSNRMTIWPTRTSGKGSQFEDGLPPAVNLLMGAGYWLLLKAAEKTQHDQWSHLGWLVGVVKYMEAIFGLLPYVKPPLPPLAFSKLFSMHIHLLGSLTPSKVYIHHSEVSLPLDGEYRQGISVGHGSTGDSILNEQEIVPSPHSLKIAVRESLGTLLRTASRHHSVLALQSIMRTLVGEDSSHSFGLEICGLKGGKVGSQVAASIECLLIALESVSGTKRLRLLANHFNKFFGAVFNLIELLQGSHLFHHQVSLVPLGARGETEGKSRLGGKMVDSGPVILQALQILIAVSSRDTVFPMKACHVALALHCPARIFWSVYHSGLSEHKFVQGYFVGEQAGPEKVIKAQLTSAVKIDTELGVKLYVSCCRLLCSLIRHRRRESGHCVALLGDSARVLLKCLEAPNWSLSEEGGDRSWSIKMAAYCASWLRRIYEEMGEHKETLGKYCSHMLSDYLSVLSGHGPCAAGLMREVEVALQPGAYVLVDACSANDLQQLHASLGEGPRRNALLNLRRQYQQRFKYTGKV